MGVDVATIVPVTYINSSAEMKGVRRQARRRRLHLDQRGGGHDVGLVNAARRVMMLPDQHLGRNTAWKLGVPLDRMAVWDPHEAGAA